MSDLDLAAFKAKLSGIESEHSAKMAEVRQKFDESAKATQEDHDKFADRKQRLTERLRDMARNQRGEGKERGKELSFGLEDETAAPHDDLAEELAQIEKERQARELRAQSEGFMRPPSEAPQPPPVRQPPVIQQPVTPPPPIRQPPPPRRPQRPVVDDDDDMSNQSWLS